MKTALFSCFLLSAVAPVQAVIVSFNYSQTDSATGAGTISPFVYNDGGGDISFSSTPMPASVVRNPVPGSTPAGFVGAQNAQAGASNEGNVLVGLTWSGFVTAIGTRGPNTYSMQIPLVFVAKQTQAPDINDYTWNVAFGDNFNGGADTLSASMRFMMLLSIDTVVDAAETPDTFQRYTQLNHTFATGAQDNFVNTDTSTGAIKDATDGGAPAGNDAAGRNLAFYYGWRDQGALTSGAILINDFTVGGLLDANVNTLTLIPEPSTALLALGAIGLALRRRRQ